MSTSTNHSHINGKHTPLTPSPTATTKDISTSTTTPTSHSPFQQSANDAIRTLNSLTQQAKQAKGDTTNHHNDISELTYNPTFEHEVMVLLCVLFYVLWYTYRTYTIHSILLSIITILCYLITQKCDIQWFVHRKADIPYISSGYMIGCMSLPLALLSLLYTTRTSTTTIQPIIASLFWLSIDSSFLYSINIIQTFHSTQIYEKNRIRFSILAASTLTLICQYLCVNTTDDTTTGTNTIVVTFESLCIYNCINLFIHFLITERYLSSCLTYGEAYILTQLVTLLLTLIITTLLRMIPYSMIQRRLYGIPSLYQITHSSSSSNMEPHDHTYIAASMIMIVGVLIGGLCIESSWKDVYYYMKKKQERRTSEPNHTITHHSTTHNAQLPYQLMIKAYLSFLFTILFILYPLIYVIIQHEPIQWVIQYLFHIHPSSHRSSLPHTHSLSTILSSYIPSSLYENHQLYTLIHPYYSSMSTRMLIVTYWITVLLIGITIAPLGENISDVNEENGSRSIDNEAKSSSESGKQASKTHHHTFMNHIPNILIRKYYHILAVFIFTPSILIDIEFTSFACSVAILVFILCEYIRISMLPPLGSMLHRYMSTYIDQRDTGLVILTHLYLLIGCALPIWMHLIYLSSTTSTTTSSSFIHLLPSLSGIIILGVGDTFASLIGVTIGKHKWCNESNKSIEGTIGAILSMIFFIASLQYICVSLNLIDIIHTLTIIQWLHIILCTTLIALLEAFTDQIDNLFLPIYYYAMLSMVA